MVNILEQEQRLLVKGTLNFHGSLAVVPDDVRGSQEPHRIERLVFFALSFLASL